MLLSPSVDIFYSQKIAMKMIFFPLKDAMKMILGYKDECWGGRVHELRRAVVSDSSRGSTGSSC